MAFGSLLALLDDIATVLDDVAVLTKVAARKTAGVLGDDLALNAQQVSGLDADRELPVVWAVAKGSLLNKAILVPVALALSAFAPWAVTPVLMLGGAYLCFEGFEKLAHKHVDDGHRPSRDHGTDAAALEKDRIRGAIRTDFILSAEIIVISLGTVAAEAFLTRALVLGGIAVGMTFGVYGLVAGIVKLDDAGLWLSRRPGPAARMAGTAILASAPWLMKGLSVAGMVAMFLVGGSIIVHGVPPLAHAIEAATGETGGAMRMLIGLAVDGGVGLLVGAVAVGGVLAARKAAEARKRTEG